MRLADYPANLMREICPECEQAESRPKDFCQTLAYVLAGLPERERDVIRARFKDGDTLRAYGKKIGVSGDRVRQIEAKALAKLKAPTANSYLRFGVEACIKTAYNTAYYEAGAAAIAKMKAEIQKHNDEVMKEPKQAHAITMPIETLELSVRAYHCMTRRGLKTVYDILQLTGEDFRRTRNLGVNTSAEIIRKLEKNGYECEHLKLKRRTEE